jgi:microcystin degradation protein MlrC
MVAAGIGANVTLALGGKTDMPSVGLRGRPLEVSGRVQTITNGEIVFTGPMYTGVRSSLGRTAVLDTGRAQIVVTERHHEPFDQVIFRHCGIEPAAKRFVMLKSRIHYRAGFKPIAGAIVECQGEGVTNADLSVYRYERLKRPICPLDPV